MKQLRTAFDQRHVVLDLDASDIASAIRGSVRHMVAAGIIPEQAADQVTTALLEREQVVPTAIGNAVAVPHAYLDGIEEQTVLFVRLAHSVNLGALDGIPTRFLFFLLGPPGSAASHLDTLASIARVMSDDQFRYEMGEARSADDLLLAFDRASERTSPEPAAQRKQPDGLTWTGQLCGGLRQDVARRWPHYLSDIRDGLHAKCVGSTLFLYFACLAPAVTFGGVMAVQTGGQIGAVEMIAASAFCGVAFALFSGQPLIILGGTGPLLVFTAILFRLCSDMGLPFLASYGWVGLWSAGFL